MKFCVRQLRQAVTRLPLPDLSKSAMRLPDSQLFFADMDFTDDKAANPDSILIGNLHRHPAFVQVVHLVGLADY